MQPIVLSHEAFGLGRASDRTRKGFFSDSAKRLSCLASFLAAAAHRREARRARASVSMPKRARIASPNLSPAPDATAAPDEKITIRDGEAESRGSVAAPKRRRSERKPVSSATDTEVATESMRLPKTAFAALVKRGATIKDIGEGSWVAILPNFYPPESPEQFKQVWESHPPEFRVIKMFGKEVQLPRWQQAYGGAYKYSGSVSEAIAPTPLVQSLMDRVNSLIKSEEEPQFVFNMCLCNWYAPDHYIGPHADDTRQLVADSPIASLSWGHTRIFVLNPIRKGRGASLSLDLNNGDLMVMGGRCQSTHKHEVLKLKKNEAKGNRINFTLRCFREEEVQGSELMFFKPVEMCVSVDFLRKRHLLF